MPELLRRIECEVVTGANAHKAANIRFVLYGRIELRLAKNCSPESSNGGCVKCAAAVEAAKKWIAESK
jgi:hypothetical protein